MDERVLQVLRTVAQGLTVDNDWPPECKFCHAYTKYAGVDRHENHDADCETTLAREVLTELGEEW